jgi:hypothetical protein
MRKQLNVYLDKLKWSRADGDYIHLFRVDAFLPTGSLAPALVTPAGNMHGVLTYFMSHYAQPETIGSKNGIALTVFVLNLVPEGALQPFPYVAPPHNYIMFTIDQDGWDGTGEFGPV